MSSLHKVAERLVDRHITEEELMLLSLNTPTRITGAWRRHSTDLFLGLREVAELQMENAMLSQRKASTSLRSSCSEAIPAKGCTQALAQMFRRPAAEEKRYKGP
ncbi:hypothetical protein JTB14_001401 [Gonioctena quinquepunctata]|nr:hypothetical protein JTB14_001401 [Gonioctena quinquepunctata]